MSFNKWPSVQYKYLLFFETTIMGNTADLAMVQKTIIDTPHTEGKSQRGITERGCCSRSAVSKHIKCKVDWKEENVHKQQGWVQAWEYSQAKPIQTLGRACNWSWSASRVTTLPSTCIIKKNRNKLISIEKLHCLWVRNEMSTNQRIKENKLLQNKTLAPPTRMKHCDWHTQTILIFLYISIFCNKCTIFCFYILCTFE